MIASYLDEFRCWLFHKFLLTDTHREQVLNTFIDATNEWRDEQVNEFINNVHYAHQNINRAFAAGNTTKYVVELTALRELLRQRYVPHPVETQFLHWLETEAIEVGLITANLLADVIGDVKCKELRHLAGDFTLNSTPVEF